MNTNEIKIESEIFDKFRIQFNAQLQHIFTKMLDMNLERATISVKFDIDLNEHEQKYADDYSEWVKSPIFTHKISTTVQLKSEDSGVSGDFNRHIFWNRDKECYELVLNDVRQLSMFDND